MIFILTITDVTDNSVTVQLKNGTKIRLPRNRIEEVLNYIEDHGPVNLKGLLKLYPEALITTSILAHTGAIEQELDIVVDIDDEDELKSIRYARRVYGVH